MEKKEKIKALKHIISDLKFEELKNNPKDENFEEIYKDLEKDINQLSRIARLKFLREVNNVKQ